LTIRTLYVPALIVAAVLMACAVAVSTVSQKAEATFPGKNGRIAYSHGGTIYTIKPGGGGRVQLTHDDGGNGRPSYSPDGRRIVYAGYDGNDSEIYTMNADGGDKCQVTDNNRDDYDPSYSPDGRRIVYQGYDLRNFAAEIYTINISGNGKFRLTNDNVDDLGPSWGSRPGAP
jgi:TolB protein